MRDNNWVQYGLGLRTQQAKAVFLGLDMVVVYRQLLPLCEFCGLLSSFRLRFQEVFEHTHT